MTTPHPDTLAFMEALFGAVEPDAKLVTPLWTLQGLKSHWMDAHDIAGLAAKATDLADGNDVYVSVSAATHLPPAPHRASRRIAADNSAGIVGLWADIDIADPDVHKKWNLPPDEESARMILDRMGLRPSVLVQSGHGLQAWWLFPEFLVFDNEDDRRQAATISERWNRTMAVHAAKGPDGGDGSQRWTVDMTFDLSRVLRIPGTMNRKGDPHVPVRLLELNDDRYTLDDFEEFCFDEATLAGVGQKLKPTKDYQVGQLVLKADATISVDLLEGLREDPKFDATWERKRNDFGDNSGSSYDLALASMAANIGIDDQTIADLIIHFRRKHKDKPDKALRLDYMQGTIAKAREGKAREDAAEELEDATREIAVAQQTGDDEEVDKARRKVLDVIGTQLGIEVTKIVRYMSDPPTFRLHTPTHIVELGGPEDVRRMDRFATSIWTTIGQELPAFRKAEWSQLLAAMPTAWVEQDIGYEATETGQMESWLAQYLHDYPPLDTADEAVDQERPFYDKQGRMMIFSAAFRRHLNIKYAEKITLSDVHRRLTNYGCTRTKVNVSVGKKRTSKSVWQLPDGWEREAS